MIYGAEGGTRTRDPALMNPPRGALSIGNYAESVPHAQTAKPSEPAGNRGEWQNRSGKTLWTRELAGKVLQTALTGMADEAVRRMLVN